MSGISKTFSQAVSAGQTLTYKVSAKFLRLLSGTAVDVMFYLNGAEVGIAEQVDSGFSLKSQTVFDEVRIFSATSQTLKISVGYADVGAASVMTVIGQIDLVPVQMGSVSKASSVLLGIGAREAIETVNPNGIKLLMASARGYWAAGLTGHGVVLMAKLGGVPANINDGFVLSRAGSFIGGASSSTEVAVIDREFIVPAGYQLHWLNASGVAMAGGSRLARYSVL